MGERLRCPHCGKLLDRFDQPRLTVDAAVENERGEILLIERGEEPPGWALPGGFVDPGETLEEAVVRELHEETGLVAAEIAQFHTYSDPERDPRHHTVTTVFLVRAPGTPQAGDDAVGAAYFAWDSLPSPLAFDHGRILKDIRRYRRGAGKPGQ